MAEQQLVDYIKKAKQAGQSDDQSRVLLLKNGWTEAEVNDAFAVLGQPQAQVQQPKIQPAVQQQSKIQPQAQPQYQPDPKGTPEPQYQPQTSAAATQSNMLRTRSGSHLILKLFVVLIIVVLLGGAGYFVGGQYLNLPYANFFSNLFGPNPETVISKMMANMSGVKAYQSTVQGSVSATDNKNISQGKVLFSADSKSDATSPNNLKADATFTIQITPPGSATPSVSANMNMLIVDNKFYIKINDITLPGEVLLPGLDISQIKGKFFKIDQDSIKALSQAQGATIDISQVTGATQLKQIQDLILSENMLSVDKQLADEIVSGQSTYHYLLKISKEKLTNLLAEEMVAIQTESDSHVIGFATEEDKQAFLQNNLNHTKQMAGVIGDVIGDSDIEVWIGKKDYMLYRFKIDKAVDLNKISQGVNMTLAAKLDVTNSNFGKTISVQAPAEAQKIEDVILPLLKTQKISADMNQIRITAQIVFDVNSSFSSLCNRGLLNGYLAIYGTNLINLNNDIVSQGGKKPLCFADATDFCVSTQLLDGSYLCAGKNGPVGTTKCVSSKTICE